MLQALTTPISMFPDTLGGFAEKVSITSHSGDWGGKETAAWEAALTIPPTQQSDMDRTKSMYGQPKGAQWLNRSNLLFAQMSSSRFGTSLLEGLADPLQLAELRAMQEANTATSFVSSSQELSSEAARWSHGAQGAVVEGHMTNCIHFTNAEGVIPLPNAMAFPLDRSIMTYKGHTEYPSHAISMLAGIVSTPLHVKYTTFTLHAIYMLAGIVSTPLLTTCYLLLTTYYLLLTT